MIDGSIPSWPTKIILQIIKMEKFKKQFGELTAKENSAEQSETLVADHAQRELMRRYLERELGENYGSHEKKVACELEWVKKHAPIFRAIFNANKDEFLKIYKEDKNLLVDAIEEALEDPL